MVQIEVSSSDPLAAAVDLLALPCAEGDASENPLVAAADRALDGAVRQAIVDEHFRGKPGQVLTLHTLGRIPAKRLALVGRDAGAMSARELLPLGGRVTRLARALGAKTAGIVVPDRTDATAATPDLESLAEGATLGLYQFTKYLTGDRATPAALERVTLFVPAAADAAPARAALARAAITARAVGRARDLVNEPAGTLTPSRLASTAGEWAHAASLEIEVLDREACRKLGMGLYLAVAQGSVEEPRFIHLTWKPPGARRRVVLVGKGVTFDSGGLSLKTNDGMLDMKTDMAGAATVIAATTAAAEERLPIEIHALAACTENMPSGSSYKLGDVLTSMAGKTIEINNTDAEGRLTLADAITFGLRLAPDVIIDLATLTGACMVALGPHIAGVMSNDDALAGELLAASAEAGEDMWRLPLPPRLVDQLKSDIADMKNTGERWGGALTAGLFLKEFVGDTPWVHIDIAGPSSADKENAHVSKGGTGFAVASLLTFLRRAASATTP
jgi:leucyl aminopeptidase